MKYTSFIVSALMLSAVICASADTLNGNGSWQSWSTSVLSSPGTGPYWNGNSGDGPQYNIGWCIAGGGNCQITPTPGVLNYFGNGNAAASNMYFTGTGATQAATLLGAFSNQNGNPPSGTDYFGWYTLNSNGTIGSLNTLFNSTQAIGTTVNFTPPAGNYGFFLENIQSPGTSYTANYFWLMSFGGDTSSGPGAAPTDGGQHFAAFAGPAGSYFLGVEDTPFATSDFDFNDMIVELQPVPEPGSIALFACGLGLVGTAMRRRLS